MIKKMQCKDIPEKPIIDFLYELHKKGVWGNWFEGAENSVASVMPPNTPEKLVRAKMNQMMRKGKVNGCPCGCRGDYRLDEMVINDIEVDLQIKEMIKNGKL